MVSEQIGLPPEIARFSISRDSFEKILREMVADDISTVEINGEEAEITVPISYLEKVVGEKYGEEIDKLEFENGEVTVWKSEQSTEDEENEN